MPKAYLGDQECPRVRPGRSTQRSPGHSQSKRGGLRLDPRFVSVSFNLTNAIISPFFVSLCSKARSQRTLGSYFVITRREPDWTRTRHEVSSSLQGLHMNDVDRARMCFVCSIPIPSSGSLKEADKSLASLQPTLCRVVYSALYVVFGVLVPVRVPDQACRISHIYSL